MKRYEIWKVTLTRNIENYEVLPAGAKVLAGGIQGGSIVIWFQVEPERPMEKRLFVNIFTGEPFNQLNGTTWNYICTNQMPNGIVIHTFEKIVN